MLGATLPGDIPNIVPVLVEDEGRVGLGDPPGALFDLMLELVPSPASVAEDDEDLCRPSLVADVLQDRAMLDVIERRSVMATVSGRR